MTTDRKLSAQQDLTRFDIAVLLIRSRANRLEDIRPHVPELLETLRRARPRALTTVDNQWAKKKPLSKVNNCRRGYLIEARLIGSDAEPAMPEDDYY